MCGTEFLHPLSFLQLFRADLCIVKELGDRAAQGRTYGNLGNTYYLLGNFRDAVASHEQVSVLCHKLNCARQCKNTHTALCVNRLSSSVCLSLKSLVTDLQRGEPTATLETLAYSLGSLRGLQNITGEGDILKLFFLREREKSALQAIIISVYTMRRDKINSQTVN